MRPYHVSLYSNINLLLNQPKNEKFQFPLKTQVLTMNFDFSFSVFGLFAVIVSWLMASLYLATSVAIGDLCVSPDGYITKSASNAITSDVLSYYIHCESINNNPFTRKVREGVNATGNMRIAINSIKQLADLLFKDQQVSTKLISIKNEINTLERLWLGLQTFLDCKPVHKQYVTGVKSLCHLGL